jgi:hypothetical protein
MCSRDPNRTYVHMINPFWESDKNIGHYFDIRTRGDIFRIENPSVWQIPMLSQIFPTRNMDR